MKKILALLTVLLCGAPSVKAAVLWVQNLTKKPINVAVKGALVANTSLNAQTIRPGEDASFNSAPFTAMGDLLRFAFTNEMKKKRYAFYETYSIKKSPKKANITFPITHFYMPQFDIQRVQIAMKSGQPAIRQSYPKMGFLSSVEQPWRPFKRVEITRKAQIGKTAEW